MLFMAFRPRVTLLQLGRMAYRPALEEQLRRVAKAKLDSSQHALLLVEHDPVYTTGIRTRDYPESEEKRLKALGADFIRTNRGGLITFHGPGQLVAYPILNLRAFVPSEVLPSSNKKRLLIGMKWYIHTLEQTVIDTLLAIGLHGQRSPHTGVWLEDDKVCAMGVHNSELVTSHGLALNCCPDMTWYKHIVPCGIRDKGVTSLSLKSNRHVPVKEMEPLLLEQFEKNFQCQVAEVSSQTESSQAAVK